MGIRSKPPKNIGMIFEHYADAKRPGFHLDRPFDIAPDGGITYSARDLANLVRTTSAALYAAGLRPGNRLAIIKENHFDVVLLAAAAARIGALPAMISSTIEPESLRKMMDRLKPSVLVAAPAVLLAAAEVGCDLTEPGVVVIATGRGPQITGSSTFEDFRGAEIPPASPRPSHEPMISTHTSGTTGVPKLVVHSADTLLGVLGKLETLRIPFLSTRRDDVIASSIAFVHGRAITWAMAQLVLPPAKVVIISDSSPHNAIASLSLNPPTTLEACPNIFQRWEGLTATHPHLFAGVRAYINTFDAIHPSTVRKFQEASRRRAVVWGQVWGQSEVGPVSMGIYTRGMIRRACGGNRAVTNTVGWPIPLVTRVRVFDPQIRRPVRRGKAGLVTVKTKGRCLAYIGEDDRYTEKVWDGWWNTGDIGLQSRLGRIRIIDREVDIIPGMSGIELESLLLERLDSATEVIVLGVPGRDPLPVISTADGALGQEAWKKATEHLPPLSDPVLIDWEDFPRTGTWKVRRYTLRERLLSTTDTFGTGRWT